MKWDRETVFQGLNELIQIEFITHDASTEWVCINTFLEWNPIKNPNQGKSIEKLFKQVPPQSIIFNKLIMILINYKKHFSELFQNHLKNLSNEFQNQEQEQKQDQNKNQDKKQFQEQDDDVGATDVAPSSNALKIPCTKKTCLVQNNLSVDIEIPLQNNDYFLVNPAQLEHWKKAYSNIDVIQELRKIQAWNESNPSERKTEATILRHINSWLAKEQREYLHRQQALSINHPNRLAKSGLNPTLEHNLTVGKHWLNSSKTEK